MTPEMAEGHRLIVRYFALRNTDTRVTCVRGGTHGPNSKHPQGNAVDYGFQGQNAIANREAIGDGLRECLNEGCPNNGCSKVFDVVPEITHWHVEYDPK